MRDILDVGGMMFISAAIGVFISVLMFTFGAPLIMQIVLTAFFVVSALIMFLWSLSPKKRQYRKEIDDRYR